MKNKSCCGKCNCVKSPNETDEMVKAREEARKRDEKRRKRNKDRYFYDSGTDMGIQGCDDFETCG
jgi:hypothetical protein